MSKCKREMNCTCYIYDAFFEDEWLEEWKKYDFEICSIICFIINILLHLVQDSVQESYIIALPYYTQKESVIYL